MRVDQTTLASRSQAIFPAVSIEGHHWLFAITVLGVLAGVVAAFTAYTWLKSRGSSDAVAGPSVSPERDGCTRITLALIIVAVGGLILGVALLALGRDARVHSGWMPKPVLSTYPALGVGHCLDQSGGRPFQGADVSPWDKAGVSSTDGRSPTCQDRCTQDASCVGIVTNEAQSCLLLTEADFLPSDSDGTPGLHCFWRHPWLANSAIDLSPRPVPPVIWSYWATSPINQNQLEKPAAGKEQDTATRFLTSGKNDVEVAGQAPAFVSLAMKSWAALNPNHTVRLVNQDTLGEFVAPEDLPATFLRMDPTHQADAVRLALLTRHGGVWVDASGLMLQPLAKVMGPDATLRPFFTLDRRAPNAHERRDDGSSYVEVSFLTSLPRDPLMGRVKECFQQAFSELRSDGQPRSLEDTGLFSQRQLDTMRALALNEYLTMSACAFKALDEDAGLRRFWDSERVRKLGAFKGIFPQLAAGPEWCQMLLEGGPGADAFAQDVISNSFLMKLRSEDRRALDGLSEHQLRCKPGAIKQILEHIGLGGETCP